jgi:hypothetical protein
MKLNFEVMNLGHQIVLNLKFWYTHKVFKNFSRDRAVHGDCYLAQPLNECWMDNGLKVCNDSNNWYCLVSREVGYTFSKEHTSGQSLSEMRCKTLMEIGP